MRRLAQAPRLPACSWVERSPAGDTAILCHVFILRFGSGLEGISEPWEALRAVLRLCMRVLSIQYGTQKAKVKLLVKETAISGEVLKTGENRQTEQVTQMHPTG